MCYPLHVRLDRGDARPHLSAFLKRSCGIGYRE